MKELLDSVIRMSNVASTIVKSARKRINTVSRKVRGRSGYNRQLGGQLLSGQLLSGQLSTQFRRKMRSKSFLGKGVLKMQGKPLNNIKRVRRKATRAIRGRR